MTAYLLDYAVKITAILLIVFAVLPLLRKQSASLRHGVMLSAISLSVLMPVLVLLMPAWNIGYLLEPSASMVQLQIATGDADTTGVHSMKANPVAADNSLILERLFVGLWLGGVGIGCIVLLTGIRRLSRLASASLPVTNNDWLRLTAEISDEYGLRRTVSLMQSRNTSILVTWGLRHPKVLLPAGADQWSEERINVVLRHELAHVRRCDWIAQLLAEGLRILYWFNPLLWIACSRLRLESEHACDDAAIANGIAGSEYAAHLLDLARILNSTDRAWSAALSMARPSTVERRFSAMLSPTVNRVPISLRAILLTLACAICIALPLAALSASTPPELPSPMAPALRTPAQSTPITSATPELSGIVTDQRNLVMPGVEITVSGSGIATSSITITDSHGQYQAANLPSGTYQVTFAQPGFKTSNVENVSITSGATLTINQVMQISATAEEVTIEAGQQPATRLFQPGGQRGRSLSRQAAGSTSSPSLTGGSVIAANLIAKTNPVYPPEAQAANVQGVVVLRGVIGIDGLLTDIEIISGPPVLIPASVDAVKQWRYEPTLLDGLPMPVASTITLNFALP